MERFLKVFLVLAVLLYFAEKNFLQLLIYFMMGIEFLMMIAKEAKRFMPILKQRQSDSD